MIDTSVKLGHFAKQLIVLIELAVAVGISKHLKDSTRELVVGIILIHLCQLNVALNEVVDKLDFHNLVHLSDSYRDFFLGEYETCRTFNFTDYPSSIRHFGKRKTTVICRCGSLDSIFFCKFLCTCLKDTDYRTAESLAVLVELLTADRAVNDVVADSFAVICCDVNGCCILSCIFKDYRVLLVADDICGICRKLFYIVACNRQIGCDLAITVLVKGNNLNQAVGRYYRTVCGCNILFSIQAKGYIKDFTVVADTVCFVCFKALCDVDFYTLSFVIEARCRFGNSHILTCINKLDRMDFIIQHHSKRSCDFLDLIFSEVQFL